SSTSSSSTSLSTRRIRPKSSGPWSGLRRISSVRMPTCRYKTGHHGAYATQEPFHIADWDADERVPARLKQGIAAKGLRIGPLVFVPLTTPHRRLGALGMSGPFGTAYSSEDIGFLCLI